MENTAKYKRVPTRVHTREIDREVARATMKKRGLKQIAKDKKRGSFFSENWREFANL